MHAAADGGWLSTAMAAMGLLQMIVQARWSDQAWLLPPLPYIDEKAAWELNEAVRLCLSHRVYVCKHSNAIRWSTCVHVHVRASAIRTSAIFSFFLAYIRMFNTYYSRHTTLCVMYVLEVCNIALVLYLCRALSAFLSC